MRIPALNRVVALLLICLVTVASPLPAALTPLGNVEPSNLSLWHSNTHGYIGKSMDGSVLVDNGSSLVSNSGTLGYQLGAVGTATINGLGSKWTMANSLNVGRYGTGNLNIESGGQVNNLFSYVGRYVGSSGAATVTGAGSKWTNTNALYVGFEGDGRLTVEDGGEVSTSTLFASLSDLYGDGTIAAEKGAVLDSDLVFDASHGPQQNIAFGSGGQLAVNWAENGALGAGYKQNGSIVVADGIEVTTGAGFLGYQAGAKGVATITGSKSRWTIEGQLFLGYSGEGSLSLESGGKLRTGNTILGLNPDSTGTIIVTGEGSHWTSSVISVGSTLPSGITSEDDGVGKLIIEAGGLVDSGSASIRANSTARITGPGSRWNSSDYIGVDGSVLVESGGQTDIANGSIGGQGIVEVRGPGSHWFNDNSFSVNGTLRVLAGGEVSNDDGRIGFGTIPDVVAAVLISGVGSQWNNSDELDVGSTVRGLLTVSAGGLVNVGGTLSINDGYFPPQTGSFINLATGGQLALWGEADGSLVEYQELIEGTDSLRYWDASLADWAPLTAATFGEDYTLEYLTTGEFAGFTMLTVGRVGDVDNDGDIDGRDFLALQRNPELGSFADWQNAYDSQSLSATNAVPEPGCLALLWGLMFFSGHLRTEKIWLR